MREEQDWGECPRCGGPTIVTWQRTYSTNRGSRQRAGVRVRSRCLGEQCGWSWVVPG